MDASFADRQRVEKEEERIEKEEIHSKFLQLKLLAKSCVFQFYFV
jgi:hypothetical protein